MAADSDKKLITFLSTVRFTIIAPAGFAILTALKATARAMGCTLTITSACDGEHSGPDDPHHKGEAYDVRSHGVDPRVIDVVMKILGTKRFFGFLESPGTPNEHFHIQRRKNTTFTIEDFLFEEAFTAPPPLTGVCNKAIARCDGCAATNITVPNAVAGGTGKGD